MFERFTSESREVVAAAQQAARDLQHDYVGTEHELLAPLRDPDSITSTVLGDYGITASVVRDGVLKIVGHGSRSSESQIPFTPFAKKVLELSLRESLGIQRDFIAPEAIFLGLLRIREGAAMPILLTAGVDVMSARSKVLDLVGAVGHNPPPLVTVSLVEDPESEIVPSQQLADLLRSATARAVIDGRSEVWVEDLVDVLWKDQHARALIQTRVVEDTKGGTPLDP